MSRLVAELLELARLDRSSSLSLTRTDLALLVRDAAADAAAVEPDRPISVQAPAELAVVADEPRIRQVLANLLANVREHTPAGTPVALRLSAAAGWRPHRGGRRRPRHEPGRRGPRLRPLPPGHPGRGQKRRRQRPGAVDRAGHRGRAQRSRRPGLGARTGHPGPRMAARRARWRTLAKRLRRRGGEHDRHHPAVLPGDPRRVLLAEDAQASRPGRLVQDLDGRHRRSSSWWWRCCTRTAWATAH